jgi:hypothetical protein
MSPARSPKPADAATHVKRLATAVARQIRRDGAPELDPAGMAWIEQHPQSLWALLDTVVTACNATKRDDAFIVACLWLLANQLELIRYRLESGHPWAEEMLTTYQQKLVALIGSNAVPTEDWFELVKSLQIAKVPVRPEMTEAMAQAAADATPDTDLSPGEVPQQMRDALDMLAKAAENPFMAVQGLVEIGALMPPDIRAYLTHEMALSPHSVLREAVSLLLLDPEPMVRKAAAAGLEQVAGSETFSPTMLRRALLIRNWVPVAERVAIDHLIRKARSKGVECGQWEPAPKLAIYASVLDGSGAQGVIITTAGNGAGLFAGLLLKAGFGLRDSWCDLAVPRRQINRSLKDTQQSVPWLQVDRDFLDLVVQHHIATGLAAGNLPQVVIVQIAEAVGGSDWKDRGFDLAAETQTLFSDIPEAERSNAGIVVSLQRSGAWLEDDPAMQSWFEDNAEIRHLVTQRPHPKPAELRRRMLEQVLPAHRQRWAEKSLLMALYWRAAGSGPAHTQRWQDFAVLAHELLSDRPLSELPPMVVIAERSLFVARSG